MNLLQKIIRSTKKEYLLIFFVLLIAGIVHGFNMFHFPYFENDEGTYMSQAWSLLTHGKLAPYTYWYDHAPAGWIFIACWVILSGGFFTFGPSVDSGRALMLLLHLASSFLLYFCVKKITKSSFPAALSVLLFSLSPLGIYFQRRVLLDNLMVFWMFVSLALLLRDKVKLSTVMASALSFGIAVLSKEYAIFFIPAYIYLLLAKTNRHHKAFAVVQWICICGIVISFYFLYALLNGEFFPVGFLGNTTPHVSMLTSFSYQLGRGGGLPFWNKNSIFMTTFLSWLKKDSLIILLGASSSIIGLLGSIKSKTLRLTTLLVVGYWIFLLRGKEIIDFYITPLIPFLSMSISIQLYFLIRLLTQKRTLLFTSVFATLSVVLCLWMLAHPIGQYTSDETTPQLQATNWIKSHLPQNAYIAIDDYDFVDLHAKRFPTDTVYPHADWYYKILLDPQISKEYGPNLKKLNYIALSHTMLNGFREIPGNTILPRFSYATLQQKWGPSNPTTYINLTIYKSTYGDWADIYKVENYQQFILDNTWKYYKQHFIISYGQVIDPSNGHTTSEGQAYALLRSVWTNDRSEFDGVLAWTKDHLEYRTTDTLFSWLWERKDGTYTVGDSASASDADEDIALSLLFAYKQWGNQHYLDRAKAIISDIWKKEVIYSHGEYVLTAGSDAQTQGGYLVNPSYLSPAWYRIFAQVDPKHPWNRLATDSYNLLNKLQTNDTLPPDWVILANNGQLISAEGVKGTDATNYGFDAFRVYYRVALDEKWFGSQDAKTYLASSSPFFAKQWQAHNSFYDEYTTDGSPVILYSNLSTSTGPLSDLLITQPHLAQTIYARLYTKALSPNITYWNNPTNYYDQNWAWFGTALSTNNLPNLWVSH